ncbi:hypothetical protein WBJ53_10750 [Spirosoma sp. SC4-14]|uniref:hypothetical protein n=1 Tax=Spirosoma sp. SC4-14 TaxID=3128900 RepID=UPI0030D1F8F0
MPTLQHESAHTLAPIHSRSAGGLLGGALLAVPVLAFAVIWNYYAVNVPKWDDHALRNFLYLFDQEDTVSGKIYQFFRQHNEHRIVYDRLIAFLDYKLTGKLNFRHLMAVGNLSLVGLLLVCIGVFRREGRSPLYALPVALILLNLANWENMFWGMASLQNFSVVLWVVLSIYWLTYTKRWELAIASAVLATLTSGNGILVWPIGAVLLILQLSESRISSKNKFRPLIIWLCCAALILALYFTGYEKPAGNPPDRGSFTDLTKGWLAFLGASADVLPIKSPLQNSILLGCFMAILAAGLLGWGLIRYSQSIVRSLRQLNNPKARITAKSIPAITLFFWGCVAFIIGTAAVVAWSRTGFGLDMIITSRYKIYSLTLLALLYVYCTLVGGDTLGRWIMGISLAGSILFYWASYFSFLDDTIWFRHWQTTNQFNWTYTNTQPIATSDSITNHYTDPSPAFYDNFLPVLYGPAQSMVVPITLSKAPHGYIVETSSLLRPELLTRQTTDADAGCYLLARSPKRSYLFPVWPNRLSLIQARLWPANQFTNGFKADIWTAEMDAGTYHLFIVNLSNAHQCMLLATNQLITSAGRPKDIQKNW